MPRDTTRRIRDKKKVRLTRLLVLAFTLTVATIALMVSLQHINRAPRLLGPYLERRASGHNPLIEKAGVAINYWLQIIDRGELMPRSDFPDWAPHPKFSTKPASQRPKRTVLVSDSINFRAALDSAHPGDMITLMPGTYDFTGTSLEITRGGTDDAPVIVRAQQPGSAILNFALLEGFHVQAPYWKFENLRIVGRCKDHSSCEHAFHIVGAAKNTVIRGNDILNFNAHIKINGANGKFPDDGIIEGNRLTNQTPRITDAPVTPIDLVAANRWRIEDNLIADFVKQGGDHTSYGAFAKGGGEGNRFVRNIVLCEHRLRGSPGQRVGLSFGGGGTGRSSCRDGRCFVEHELGEIRGNLLASCSDNGIYINRSPQTKIADNTLLDTAGINVRFPESSAVVLGNWLDGPIAVNDQAQIETGDNRSPSLPSLYLGLAKLHSDFANQGELDLRWRERPPRHYAQDKPPRDLCATQRSAPQTFGAFENIEDCVPKATNR
jgi:hypothetical protein